MTLNGVKAVILRYFTEFGKPCVPTRNRVDLSRNLCTNLLYFVVRVRCRRKKFTFAISSPDEFLALIKMTTQNDGIGSFSIEFCNNQE